MKRDDRAPAGERTTANDARKGRSGTADPNALRPAPVPAVSSLEENAMKPSRELDAAVATVIFGKKVCRDESCEGCNGPVLDEGAANSVPRYSERIEDAMKIVERLGGHFFFHLSWMPGHNPWVVTMDDTSLGGTINEGGEAATLPLAIVLAALKAHGVEVPGE